MQRRSHKKSRGGCLECKRRHVKCDGGRPVCLLCKIAERECSYSVPSRTAQALPTPGASPQSRSISPGWRTVTAERNGDGRREETSTDGAASKEPSELISNISIPSDIANTNIGSTASVDAPINLTHTALITHLLTTKELFTLADSVPDHAGGITYGLEIGLSYPYLLHALLAFSARHLAHLHSEPSNPCSPSTTAQSVRSGLYTQQSIALQNRAISLFNASRPLPIHQTNCVPVLLFSSVLGHHHLADTLAKRPPGGLDPFLTQYTQCVEMHRGIYTIARTAWPMLMRNARLEPILMASAGLTAREAVGRECEALKGLFSRKAEAGGWRGGNGNDGHAMDMEEGDRQACLTAVRYLQVGLDAVLATSTVDGRPPTEQSRYHMIFSWTMLAPGEFTRLLAARRPEALVVLGYYAVLLHHGRALWQVGDAGRYVLGIVEEYLGSEWSVWLEYPREMIGGT